MTDIFPAGVRDVLAATEANAETVVRSATGVDTAVGAAAGAARGFTGAVAAALARFGQAQAAGMSDAQARVDALLAGASEATQAYIDADLEMAATHDRAAAALGLGSGLDPLWALPGGAAP